MYHPRHVDPLLTPEADQVVHVYEALKRCCCPHNFVSVFEHTEVVCKGIAHCCWRKNDIGSNHGPQGDGRNVAVELIDKPCTCFIYFF